MSGEQGTEEVQIVKGRGWKTTLSSGAVVNVVCTDSGDAVLQFDNKGEVRTLGLSREAMDTVCDMWRELTWGGGR